METLHDLPVTYDEAAEAICDWMVEHYTRETIIDIAQHGCGSGCAAGLIYYSETRDFYDEYEEELWEVLNYVADDFGTTPMQVLIELQSQDRTTIETHSQLCCAIAWVVVEHLAGVLAAAWEL